MNSEKERAFMAGVLSTSILFTAAVTLPKEIQNNKEEAKRIQIEKQIEEYSSDEGLLPINENLDRLLKIQDSLYDYKKYLHCTEYKQYNNGVTTTEKTYSYENAITENNEETFYGYKDTVDENGNVTRIKTKDAKTMEELIGEGYTYVRSTGTTHYLDEEITVSHMFYGYKRVIMDNGKIVFIKSNPAYSIEALISAGYDYVKEGEIYYSYNTMTGTFIEFEDVPGPKMVERPVLTLL